MNIAIKASEMWISGKTYREIYTELEITKSALMGIAYRNPDLFPKREPANVDLQPIIDLWTQGKSSSQIAEELGMTKGAVAGRIKRNRERFPNRELVKPEKKKKENNSSLVKFNANAGSKVAEYKSPPLDDFERLRLPGVCLVENNGCMYPLTDQSPHMFCGHSRFGGKRYCKHHVDKTTGYVGIDISYRTSYDKNIRRESVA